MTYYRLMKLNFTRGLLSLVHDYDSWDEARHAMDTRIRNLTQRHSVEYNPDLSTKNVGMVVWDAECMNEDVNYDPAYMYFIMEKTE